MQPRPYRKGKGMVLWLAQGIFRPCIMDEDLWLFGTATWRSASVKSLIVDASLGIDQKSWRQLCVPGQAGTANTEVPGISLFVAIDISSTGIVLIPAGPYLRQKHHAQVFISFFVELDAQAALIGIRALGTGLRRKQEQ